MTARPPRTPTPRRQRGAATLVVALVLSTALALGLAYANRHLLVEQKAASNQMRATQAFDAAEAGIDWALAMLAAPRTVDEDCLPTAGGAPLRDLALRVDGASGGVVPRTAMRSGVEVPLRMACVAAGSGGWACRCPTDGAPLVAPPAAADAVARPAFSLVFSTLPRAGSVEVIAVGCDHVTVACLNGAGADDGGAVARLRLALALLPAIAAAPSAALTARGAVAVGGALVLDNADAPTGAPAVHAGGGIALGSAVVVRPASHTPAAASRLAGDAALAAAAADALFTGMFGLDRLRWRDLPGMVTVACGSDDCTAAMRAALAGATAPTAIRVAGDLKLAGPIAIGTAERPVALVVEGDLQLAAGSTVHGLVYVATAGWRTGGGTGGMVRGAVVAEGDVTGDGVLEIVHDAAVLARLRHAIGTYVPVPGSWRDF